MERGGADIGHFHGAGCDALTVEGEVCDSQGAGIFVAVSRGTGDACAAAVAFAYAGGEVVSPVEVAEGAEA